jgi:hypothetical protein
VFETDPRRVNFHHSAKADNSNDYDFVIAKLWYLPPSKCSSPSKFNDAPVLYIPLGQ